MALLAGLLAAAAGYAQKPPQIHRVYTADELEHLTPTSPNPYLAFLPEGVQPDWDYWESWMRVERERRGRARGIRAGVPVADQEENNSITAPQMLPNFGTGDGQTNEVTITGSAALPSGFAAGEPSEDNGSIIFASTIPLSTTKRVFSISGTIGNGPFGSSGFGTGDFDFYRMQNLSAGMVLEVQVDASLFGSALNPGVAVYNASGALLAIAHNNLVVTVGQTQVILNPDVTLRLTLPSFGDYYVAVFGEPADAEGALLDNPFNSATGPSLDTEDDETEGPYHLYVRLFDAVAVRPENNGSINLPTIVPSSGGVYSSTLGDGAFGASSGDFDFYAIQDAKRGDLLIADIDALGSPLDSFLAVWNNSGQLVAWNDDDPFGSFLFTVNENLFVFLEFDSFITFEIPADGTYYVSVGAHDSPYPPDPHNAGSGIGSASTGSYELALRIQPHNPDVFAMDLKAGDVLGADLSLFHGKIELLDPTGIRLVDSHTNLGSIYPTSSPLPFSHDTALAYVIPKDGRYSIRYSTFGRGNYTGDVSVFRPGLESPLNPEPRQRLFVDFDGAEIDRAIFGGESSTRTLSGLDAALPRWGLSDTDRDAVIDAILAVVRESLWADLRHPLGRNPLFDVEILNSRDHADPWGDPDVSRVIVGGTVSQLGILTIGIAESIDPGNFDTTESAVVLLDFLSEDENDPNSLNGIALDPSADIIHLIGEAVGNIVAHEAGHFFGSYHTDNRITAPNIMDTGGNLANLIGLGPDETFGTSDDIDVDFGVDKYDFREGFTGFEDTLNLIAFGLVAPPGSVLYVDFDRTTNGIGTLALPFNNMTSAVESVPSAGTLRFFPGTTEETFGGANSIGKRMTVEKFGAGGNAVIGKQ